MRDFANLQGEAWLLRLTGRAGLTLLFAAILTFLAPFGTYRFGAIDRLGYWTLLMATWPVLSLAAGWLVGQIPALRSRPASHRRIATILLAALPMTVAVGVATNRMIGWQPSPDEVTEVFLSILLIGGAYIWLSDWLVGTLAYPAPAEPVHDEAQERPTFATAPALVAPADTGLIDRLPPHLRDGILCLQVEDHYVRVHARHGSAMVLMRFSDALRGIDHLPGSQVHRSWWVAADAVTELRRTGRTAKLTLSNGASVPVSQPYLAQVITAWGSLQPDMA